MAEARARALLRVLAYAFRCISGTPRPARNDCQQAGLLAPGSSPAPTFPALRGPVAYWERTPRSQLRGQRRNGTGFPLRSDKAGQPVTWDEPLEAMERVGKQQLHDAQVDEVRAPAMALECPKQRAVLRFERAGEKVAGVLDVGKCCPSLRQRPGARRAALPESLSY